METNDLQTLHTLPKPKLLQNSRDRVNTYAYPCEGIICDYTIFTAQYAAQHGICRVT
ncbi:hypothetical protein RND71_009931 [Anisodus tanguticus]|uniref:Uncharacterized protein n=1 Tax=Anisodus tanguticus TaxID=243964 RepID=A0AAE1SIS8_9SOLA|nr:hypothetical protein RND71_009931 [Anisodus tanguticus]